MKKYLLNCFLLTIPILVWNLAWTGKLPAAFRPEIFGNDIPWFLVWGENISRVIIFLLTALMPLSVKSAAQKKGLLLYTIGVLLYFASWLALIYFPHSGWSRSAAGFMAPAYTPLLWLTGIGLVGNQFYFRLPFKRWIFMLLVIIFVAFHTTHTWLVYNRLDSKTWTTGTKYRGTSSGHL